jgi:hypothetical protein
VALALFGADDPEIVYIDQRREEAGSNQNLATIYTRYYDKFRKAGARHAVELRGRN